MLLLLLSRFSRVQLCATPQTAAHQGSPVPGILQARTLENPRDGGALWAAVYGVAQSWTRLKRLSSSSSKLLFSYSRPTKATNTSQKLPASPIILFVLPQFLFTLISFIIHLYREFMKESIATIMRSSKQIHLAQMGRRVYMFLFFHLQKQH